VALVWIQPQFALSAENFGPLPYFQDIEFAVFEGMVRELKDGTCTKEAVKTYMESEDEEDDKSWKKYVNAIDGNRVEVIREAGDNERAYTAGDRHDEYLEDTTSFWGSNSV